MAAGHIFNSCHFPEAFKRRTGEGRNSRVKSQFLDCCLLNLEQPLPPQPPNIGFLLLGRLEVRFHRKGSIYC